MDDIILIDKNMKEVGVIYAEVDFEVGGGDATNDFELKTDLDIRGMGIYIPGTEYGGFIDSCTSDTGESIKTYNGKSWRGLLEEIIAIPDYTVTKGTYMKPNEMIKSCLSGKMGNLFTVPEYDLSADAIIYMNPKENPKWVGMASFFQSMLSPFGYRLQISAKHVAPNAPIVVMVEAVPVQRVTGSLDSNSPLDIEFKETSRGVTHLICLGQGELEKRERFDWYLGPNGNIQTTQYYFGLDERTEVFDDSGAESSADLKRYGKKRFKEIMMQSAVDIVSVDNDIEIEIGDLVEATSGLYSVTKPLERKVYQAVYGFGKTYYTLKGDTE